MPSRIFNAREIGGIVENQMRRWELSQSEKAKTEQMARLAGREIHYITISREMGSGSLIISRALSELMGWQLYDKEVLNYMAENMNVHKSVIEHLDQRQSNWIEDFFAPMFSDKHVPQMTYYRHLVKVLFAIAQNEDAIIVGRAAGFVLPKEKGLNVRITAPLDLRCERYAEKEQITLKEAKSLVTKSDSAQKAFVKNFLNRDLTDPNQFDILFNTERMQPESVAKLIWRTFDQRKISSQEQAQAADKAAADKAKP